ncbi:MAG: AIPR family protein [Candidatus Omnitrophica bacterium]|nr:AIPR family protein [Candidatus Omnitrophota bacterium]
MLTERMIDQAYSDLKETCGGVRNDYFGLLVLERDYKVPREQALNQVAFGGNDYGLDGFHFDPDKKNLYLFQFKNSKSHAQFKGSMQRLIDEGMEVIFLNPQKADPAKNQILLQLRSCMLENREAIKQVCLRFIFGGDPSEADKSPVLDHLREDLENKKFLIDKFFEGRQVSFLVEFRSVTGKIGTVEDHTRARVYQLPLTDLIERPGLAGEQMYVGFIRLTDLNFMHRDMGPRFFERNIRFGLGMNRSVNRALSRALKQIAVDGKSPLVFAFNHNGITLAAEHLEKIDSNYHITSPRLLNGAQTVTTFDEFIKSNAENPIVKERKQALDEVRVLCKIITKATSDFITGVTINNNRQNPVEPWNLRANDLIQLQLQEKFKDDLGIFYERQENAFEALDDLDEEGITEIKPIQIRPLAQTFLITDGEVDKTQSMAQVFEDDRIYALAFNEARIRADTRHIVLCYKIHYRLRRLMNDIVEKGPNRYSYISRARGLLWALLCQGVLNDAALPEIADRYGAGLSVEADFVNKLSYLATARCRMLMSWLTDSKEYRDRVAEGNFSFLRTNTAFEKCMERAYTQWRWVQKKLR